MEVESYKEYLAARILAESRPVTYRLLSRALKVHANVAKQMLFEFHASQNAKKPKPVHATYLLIGKKRSAAGKNGRNVQDGQDTVMQSSPPMSSIPNGDEVGDGADSETTMELVQEDQLQKTQAEYEKVTSIHIYSLAPNVVPNLSLLSICNHEEVPGYADTYPLDRWRFYGGAHNPYIKRRKPKNATVASAAAMAATKATSKAAPKAGATMAKATVKSAPEATKDKPSATEARRGSISGDGESGRTTIQSKTTANTLKRSDSKPGLKRDRSDLFKSFAKAKPKRTESVQSKESTPGATEDEQMQGMSEDEGDAEDAPEVKFDEEKAAASRQARIEREEQLRQMMEDDDDEEMADVSIPPNTNPQQTVPQPAAATAVEPKPTVTVEGGRRRGRRKVMKKKMEKDKDGYLVTREEAVWESFSEEEPEPKKLKPTPKAAPSTAKGKKTGKPGQGSIANFFKKAA